MHDLENIPICIVHRALLCRHAKALKQLIRTAIEYNQSRLKKPAKKVATASKAKKEKKV